MNHGWNGLYLFDYDDPSMKKRKKKDKIEMVINRTKSVVFFFNFFCLYMGKIEK